CRGSLTGHHAGFARESEAGGRREHRGVRRGLRGRPSGRLRADGGARGGGRCGRGDRHAVRRDRVRPGRHRGAGLRDGREAGGRAEGPGLTAVSRPSALRATVDGVICRPARATPRSRTMTDAPSNQKKRRYRWLLEVAAFLAFFSCCGATGFYTVVP